MTFRKMSKARGVFINIISTFVMTTFVISSIASAAPQGKEPAVPTHEELVTNPEKIVIPRELGLIKSKFIGKEGRLVVHIQDAHCNYEAQSNIARMLENLIKNYNITLVSVEGADGYLDTSWFKSFPDEDVRREVADYFMKKGEITGPEFISITTDLPIKLFGAETRAYYIDNLNAFTTSYPLKEDTERYFNGIKTVLNRLKGFIYSEELKVLDGKMHDYEIKKLPFNEYIRYLESMAEKHRINLRQYDNLFKLISALIYEKKIDFNIVDKERGALIDELSKKMDKEILTELVTKSLTFKSGKISSAEFYAYLKGLAVKYGIDIQKHHPNLYNYIIYNAVYSRIENEKLFQDIKKIEEAVKEKLFANDDQRTLERLSRHAEILIGLINIKLMNSDFEYYEANKEAFAHEAFTDFMKAKAGQFGLAYDIEPPSEAVAKAIPKLEDFYRIAIKRDKALVDNTINAMRKERQALAVLITGGFHSDGITKLLEKTGISYMVVCPSITKDVPSPYIQILTNQRTPLEEILGAGETKKGMVQPLRMAASKGSITDIDAHTVRAGPGDIGPLGRRNLLEREWERRYDTRVAAKAAKATHSATAASKEKQGKAVREQVRNKDEAAKTARLLLNLLDARETLRYEKALQALLELATSPGADKVPDRFTLLATQIVNQYGQMPPEEREAARPTLEAFYEGVVTKARGVEKPEVARGLQIIVGNIIAVTALIDRGWGWAANIEFTTNPEEMVGNENKEENRRWSYIKSTKITEKYEVIWRGYETPETKLSGNFLSAAIYDKRSMEAWVNKQVMYTMLHVGGFHTTVMLNLPLAGTLQIVSTGKGHWQGASVDVKQVVRGELIQVTERYSEKGKPKTTEMQKAGLGEWVVAPAGTVDYVIPLSKFVVFHDFSVPTGKKPASYAKMERAFKAAKAGWVAINISKAEGLYFARVDNRPLGVNWIATHKSGESAAFPTGGILRLYEGVRAKGALAEAALAGNLMSAERRLARIEGRMHVSAAGAPAVVTAEAERVKIQAQFEAGAPMLLKPYMQEKPWGALMGAIQKVIGELWFTSVSVEAGKESRLGTPAAPGTLSLPEAIAANPAAVLGQEQVNAFGTKPALLKYLTPGTEEYVSNLSVQHHDTKNELWIVAKTTVENPRIILGFNQAKLAEFQNKREKFLEAYEKALAEFAKALEEANAAIIAAHLEGPLKVKTETIAFIKEMQGTLLSEVNLAGERLLAAEKALNAFYNFKKVEVGEVIPIPAGTVHALLRGVEVIEPQIEGRTISHYDYGRYPIRYEITPNAAGGVESINNVPRGEIFGTLNLEYKESPLKMVLGEKLGAEPVTVQELGVYPGLAIHKAVLKENVTWTTSTEGGYQILFAARGKALIRTPKGEVELNAASEENKVVMIPASAGRYEMIASTEGAEIIKSFAPVAATPLANSFPEVKAPNESRLVLTKEGTTFERATVKTEMPLGAFLEEKPVTVITERGTVVVKQDGVRVAELQEGKILTLPSGRGVTLVSAEAVEEAVAKITYPETVEERPVFTAIEAVRANLENGVIQSRMKEKKGIIIPLSQSLFDALYRRKGEKYEPGRFASEKRMVESFLSRYLQIEVKVSIVDSWNDDNCKSLMGNLDTIYAGFVPVAWITNGELGEIQKTSGENQKNILKSLRIAPISSALVNGLKKHEGQGWFYVRELEAISLLLACTDTTDIEKGTNITYDILRVWNTLMERERALVSIADLKPLFPVGEEEVGNRLASLIKKLLITMPIRPFDATSELHGRRQILWSV